MWQRGLGKSQSEPRPTSKEPATLSTAARLAFGSTSAWMSGAIDALACPRQLAAVLTSRPPAIIMVARVCLRSWNAQLRPFTLRRAERSLPSRAGLQGRPPPPRSRRAGVAARHSRLVRHALGVAGRRTSSPGAWRARSRRRSCRVSRRTRPLQRGPPGERFGYRGRSGAPRQLLRPPPHAQDVSFREVVGIPGVVAVSLAERDVRIVLEPSATL